MSERKAGLSVLVDARGLYAPGIGRYLREILAGLLEDTRFGTFDLAGDADLIEAFAAQHGASERIRAIPYPGRYYSPVSQLVWPFLILRRTVRRPDVCFFPHYDVPLVGMPRQSVVTIHDLTHFRVPEAFPLWRRLAGRLLLAHSVRRACGVITGSTATRDDLDGEYPAAGSKTAVIPHGIADIFRRGESGEPEEAEGRPYLLCVGNRKRHKNLLAAVEALAILKSSDPDLQLVVAGQPGGTWDSVLERARELGVLDRIVDAGPVDDEALHSLYRRSVALIMPSLYEGFGLPVVEAMASGCPVIAARRASLPEIVGNAGFLVDPSDYAAIASCIERLRGDMTLRDEMVAAGLRRSRDFEWSLAARRTGDVLVACAAGNHRENRRGTI